MPIVTPRRRYVTYNAFSRNRYSNFADWLGREGARIASGARSIRDKLVRLGDQSPADIEAGTTNSAASVGIVSTGPVAGGAGTQITSGTIIDTGADYVTLGVVDGDTVELTYGGADFPVEEKYIGVVSALAVTNFTVDPAPPDNAWAATADVTVSVINANARG